MIAALAAGAVAAVALATFAWLAVDGLWRPDAFDYAQIARELAEGRGFSSRHAIYALHLDFLAKHGLLASDWPNLHRFPLPSLLMAAGFRVFGATEAVVVGQGILFHGATAGLLFHAARRLQGTAAAWVCVLLLTANGTFIEIACSGLAEPPVIFFFSLSLYAVVCRWRGTGDAAALGAGLALGLAGLARTNALFAAPWLALALVLPREARTPGLARTLALFAGGVVLVSLPWWLRNQAVAGDPFFSLHAQFLLPSGTGLPGEKWDLSVPWVREATSAWDFLLAHPAPVVEKWWTNASRLLVEAPRLAGLFGVTLLAAGATRLRGDADLRRLAWLWLACFVWNALLVSFTDFFLVRYHLHLLPCAILLAVVVVWRVAAKLPDRRVAAGALGLAVLVLLDLHGVATAVRAIQAREARFDREHWPVVAERTSPDGVVVSDQSHAIAWHTGRRSVRLHFDRNARGELVLGVDAVQDAPLPVEAVYLSRQFLRDPAKRDALSRTLAQRPRFRRAFPHMHQFEEGGLLFTTATRRSPAPATGGSSPDRPPPRRAP